MAHRPITSGEYSAPIIAALKPWLETHLSSIPQKSQLAEDIRYTLGHWPGLIRFLEDGTLELDTNPVENQIRPIALTRKNALFADNEIGAEKWAMLASLVATYKMKAQAARVSRKSDLGEAMAYMLKRQDGLRLFLDDGRVDIDSNLIENAIRSPAMKRRNALFASHDEGGRNWGRFASLIGTCKMNGIEPYAYLRDLFTKLADGHLAQDIEALMPWACAHQGWDA